MSHDDGGELPKRSLERLGTVYNSAGDLAQRWAVLAACCGPGGDGTDPQIRAAVKDLMETRRRWFQQLKTHGWGYLRRGKNWTYAWNCPPIAVQASGKNMPCHQRSVCPFCWARHYAWETFLRLEHLFCDGKRLTLGAGLREQPLDYDLVELFTSTTHCDRQPRELLEQIKRDKNSLVRQWPTQGAFALNTVYPVAQGWLHEQRVLIVADCNQITDREVAALAVPDAGDGHSRTARLTYVSCRTDLAAAAARICRYPVRLLSAPVKQTVELLQAQEDSNVRLSAYYGGLRNKSERKRRALSAARKYAADGGDHEEGL